MKTCYQCEKETEWLAPDSRCGKCTRLTPEEVRGDAATMVGDWYCAGCGETQKERQCLGCRQP